MLDLGLALFLALIAAGFGKKLLDSAGELPDHPMDALALATPLGLGLLALSCLGLGEAGWLNLAGMAVLLAVVTELGLLAGIRLVRDAIRCFSGKQEAGSTGRLDRFLFVFLVVTIGATLFASLAPVTDGDALCYHLQVPKIFLIRQAVYFDPDLHETVYPLITELLYAIALEFRGPVACRCLQWVLGLVFAANVAALARPCLGRRAWWAATLALLVPAISNGMSAPLNDVALAAFGTAAIVAWTRMLDRPSRRSTLLASVFCGLTLGVKYPSLVLAGVLTLAVLIRPLTDQSWRSRLSIARTVRLATGFLSLTALVGGAWYLRAYIHTGNPVFPFFKSWFGGAGLEEVLASIKRPLPPDSWGLLTALVPLTLQPERFDSFAHQFGPVFLLFLPALIIERAPRRVIGLAFVGYLFLVLCLTQRQSMRFLLVALGPMSVGVAFLASQWCERRSVPALVLTVMLILVLGSEAGLSLTRATRAAGTVLGQETFHQFLGRCEPTYRVGRWIADHLPVSARLIGQDHRGFYIPRDYTMELAHRRRTGLGGHGESPAQLVRTLKEEGFTHVMLCPPLQQSAIEFDPTLGRLLSTWLAGRVPLFREDLADPDGVKRQYSIYELSEELGSRGNEALTR
jgi:hypothetical protein